MKLILSLTLIVSLSACATVPHPDAISRFEVTVIRTDKASDLCADRGLFAKRACTVVYSPVGCKVYISHDDYQYSPDVLAHEIRHCIEGNYHNEIPGREK